MSSPTITYAARQDATRETEMAVLASIYRIALNSASKNAAGAGHTGGDDAKERFEDDSSARTIVPDR